MKRFLFVGLCLCVAVLPIRADAPTSHKAAVAYLQKLQQKDGGFAPSVDQPKSSLRATTAAVEALDHFGGEIPDKAACADFVKSCFDKENGGFADQPHGQPNVEVTAIGVLVVAELKLTAEPFEAAAAKFLGENVKTFEDIRITAAAFEALGKRPAQADAWLKQIAKLRNEDGTYGKGTGVARATGGAIAAVIRLGGKVEHPAAAIKAMRAGQRADGGFGTADSPSSDLATSYRVMRSLHMLHAQPQDADRLQAFIDSCHNADGGYGVAKGKPSSAAGTYYVSSILHWLNEK